MKMVILAAGEGKRLRPLTQNKPKCMVEYKNKPIIDYILEVSQNLNKAIVTGYKSEVLKHYLKDKNITFFHNDKYNVTNMVYTLFCAREFLDDDIIISYSDIVYNKEILDKLIDSKGDFCVVVDENWKSLWLKRMENPLEDAETLKIKNGKIIELGKKPNSYEDIEAQYIGLIKISKKVINKIIKFYDDLDKIKLYDGQNFENMYMTTFIQLIIDNLLDVSPVLIEGGWIEIDSIYDLGVWEFIE